MFYFRSDPARSFDTLDEAIEAAEIEDSTVTIVDRYGDFLVRRWCGGRIEFPVGTFSEAESRALSLLRHKVG